MRIIHIEGSYKSEVMNAVAALATVICGNGKTLAPTAIPIGCFTGYALLSTFPALTQDGSLILRNKHTYASYAYDSIQAVVRAFAPALAGSIKTRNFLNVSSVVQLREATMKNLRVTNLPVGVTRSGRLVFNSADNDRKSVTLEYYVSKHLMTADALAIANASGIGGPADTMVTVASIKGTTVDLKEPFWSTTRWPGLGDKLPLDRDPSQIPKFVHMAMVVEADDVVYTTTAQQAVAEINAKDTYRVHRATTLVLHHRTVPVGGDYATSLEEFVQALRAAGTDVSCLVTQWSSQTIAVKQKKSLRYIPTITYVIGEESR